jgi:hypothetical protein
MEGKSMNNPAKRMRAILNYKPPVKKTIPCRELMVGDFWGGDEVTSIWKDDFFVHFKTKGRGELPQGFYPDYQIEIERKQK